MNQGKRAAVIGMAALMGMSVLTGCYNKVSKDKYANTVVATYGDQEIYLDELNFFLKMQQVTYDYYYEYLYKPYYGFSSYEAFYENTSMTSNGMTFWNALKEEAMAGIRQTYILCERAAEYNISLSDEDKKKIEESVDKFMTETDEGILDACLATEELVTEIFTKNALANRVYEYLVSDIDTTVEEADYRYVDVAYLTVKAAEKEAESSSAAEGEGSGEQEEVDLQKKAEEVLTALKTEITRVENSENEDDAIDYDAIKNAFAEDSDITVTVTSSKKYGKPAEDSTDELQKKCWNELSTGDTMIYDNENGTYYVIYCTTDDDEDSKKDAIEKELDTRRTARFEEKYKDIQENSSTFTVKSSVYNQLKFEEIKYKEEETTTSGETTSEGETSAEETSDEGTSDEETSAEEPTEETDSADTSEEEAAAASDDETTVQPVQE